MKKAKNRVWKKTEPNGRKFFTRVPRNKAPVNFQNVILIEQKLGEVIE